MSALVNLVGRTFGRLTVRSRAPTAPGVRPRWACDCQCGKSTIVPASYLRDGNTKSCGCLAKEGTTTSHGKSKTKTYEIWKSMKGRCENPKNKAYAIYGGRGIMVADRWQDFAAFIEDMGECPNGMSIDRIDNAGNYEPSNCRWTDAKTQCRNKRNNLVWSHGGESMTVAEWAERGVVSPQLLRSRVMRHGWSIDEALRTPPWGLGKKIRGSRCPRA